MAGTQWRGDTLDLDQSGGHCQACGPTQRTLEAQRVGGELGSRENSRYSYIKKLLIFPQI